VEILHPGRSSRVTPRGGAGQLAPAPARGRRRTRSRGRRRA
jgi:hypothetical protein